MNMKDSFSEWVDKMSTVMLVDDVLDIVLSEGSLTAKTDFLSIIANRCMDWSAMTKSSANNVIKSCLHKISESQEVEILLTHFVLSLENHGENGRDFVREFFLGNNDPVQGIRWITLFSKTEADGKTFEFLTSHGCAGNAVDAATSGGMSVLNNCSLSFAKAALASGVHPDNRFDERAETPIHSQIRKRNIDVVRLLLDNGADPFLGCKRTLTHPLIELYSWRKSDPEFVSEATKSILKSAGSEKFVFHLGELNDGVIFESIILTASEHNTRFAIKASGHI